MHTARHVALDDGARSGRAIADFLSGKAPEMDFDGLTTPRCGA